MGAVADDQQCGEGDDAVHDQSVQLADLIGRLRALTSMSDCSTEDLLESTDKVRRRLHRHPVRPRSCNIW